MTEQQQPHRPSTPPESNDAVDEETVVGQQTEVDFEKILKQAADEPKAEFDSEPECLELVDQMQDLETVRRLAKEQPAKDGEVPRRLGQFELLEKLGQGGMGKVFKARHAQLGKVQVVKILHQHRLGDQQATARFRQEIRALGSLSHPNIVAAHHADEVQGVPYLVMDYVEGESLQELILRYRSNRQQMPIGAACELVRQAAIGLQYAHDQGIVHRDIKPGNVMLDQFGVVRILDLGLARMVAANDDTVEELTTEYQILGTPDYMAPEQLHSSKDVDARADVYALGATLFCLLSGQPPSATDQPSGDFMEKAMQILNSPVPDIRERRQDVPHGLAQLIHASLQKTPDDRMATAGEFAEQLSLWVGDQGVEELLPPSQSPAGADSCMDTLAPTGRFVTSVQAARVRSTWKVWTLVGLCLLALFAGVIYQLSLPDGKLVIECDDPNARIMIHAAKGRDVETLDFAQDGRSLSLDIGTWRVSVSGLDADQFELTRDSVTIRKNGEQRLTVRRIAASPTGRVSSPEVAAVALAKSVDRREPPNVGAENAVPSPFDGEPGDPSRMLSGMVLQPAVLDDLFDWQILPQLRTFRGNSHPAYSVGRQRHFDVDPAGDHFAMACPRTALTVRAISTGRIRAVVPGDFWQDVCFHPAGKTFVAVAHVHQSALLVEIRDLNGKLIGRFSDASFGGKKLHAEWTPDGETLLLIADGNKAATYTPDGKQLRYWEQAGDAETYAVRDHSLHPGGQFVTWVCTDGQLRNWDLESGAVTEFAKLTDRRGLYSYRVNWSPDGQLLYTAYHDGDQTSPILQVRDVQGAVLHEMRPEKWWAMHQDIAWSPDSRFLVTADGQLLDRDLKHIRHIEVEWTFRPFWKKDNEIAGLNDIYEANSHVGYQDRVVRYTPAGRQIETPNFLHPLPAMGASWTEDGTLVSVHRTTSGLIPPGQTPRIVYHWTRDGAGSSHGEIDEFRWTAPLVESAHWNARGGSVVVDMGAAAVSMDVSGNVISTNVDRDSSVVPSPSGLRTATALIQDNDHYAIVVSDAEGRESHRITMRNGQPGSVIWSPDSRWIAWNAIRREPVQASINLVDLTSESRDASSYPIYLDQPHRNAFSPDNRWLAVDDCASADDPRRVIRLIHLQTGDVVPHTTDQPTVRSVLRWSADSRLLFSGQLFQVKDDGRLQSVGDFQAPDVGYAEFGLENDVFVGSFNQPKLSVVTSTGQLQSVIPLNPGYSIRNIDPHSNSRAQYKGSLAVMLRSERCESLAVIDTKQGQFSWNGFAFHDGRTLTLSPDGQVMDGPDGSELDRYVIHVIRYPGGRTIPITRQQFLARVAATKPQRALLWALDHGALVREQRKQLKADEWSVADLPAIETVTELELTNALEIDAAELHQLTAFANLESLHLAGSRIAAIPSLRGLEELRMLDLSWTDISELDGRLPESLRHLSLKHTKVGADVGGVLRTLPGLVSLDLSGTSIDNFTLLDIASMQTLHELKLHNVQVSESDVAQLMEKLPDCRIELAE